MKYGNLRISDEIWGFLKQFVHFLPLKTIFNLCWAIWQGGDSRMLSSGLKLNELKLNTKWTPVDSTKFHLKHIHVNPTPFFVIFWMINLELHNIIFFLLLGSKNYLRNTLRGHLQIILKLNQMRQCDTISNVLNRFYGTIKNFVTRGEGLKT